MSASEETVPPVAMRPPAQVMRLERMGAFHQSRLSFMRTLLRRVSRERWRFDRPQWRIDPAGMGVAVYRAIAPGRVYSLVCFSHELDPAQRTDRVIAEAWDATFVLVDGEPSEADIVRLASNVPRQEAGRCSHRELVLSRANKSVRLFDHVVERLAAGRQPDWARIEPVGYLMRTTAVYGNGKFGIADRDLIAGRAEFAGPFRAEMLTVWLIRAFTVDLAEHIAQARAPESAVRLDRDLRRRLGVGNSTGLGMAPFLINHPALLHRWVHARESALARVRALPDAGAEAFESLGAALIRARQLAAEWRTGDARQAARVVSLAADLERLQAQSARLSRHTRSPWDALYRWAERELSLEGQEMAVSLLLEPHGALVDDLTETMQADEDEAFVLDGAVPVARVRAQIEKDYRWALDIDFDRPGSTSRFWYVSEEKLEPRLGERLTEPGGEREQPLATGRDVARLYRALGGCGPSHPLAEVLLAHPEHRHAARRVQICARYPYAEIRDNLIGEDLLAIDLLRCKLSFFGATKFDPRSDRWVRITMYQDAPFPDEIARCPADDWSYPPLARVADAGG